MEETKLPQKKCVVCGEPLTGRSDKKFCSVECKNAYNNEATSLKRNYRNRIITSLNTNYRILEHLITDKVDSALLCDVESLGFKSKMVTGYSKIGTQKTEFRCFDIGYCLSASRIYKISRVKHR